MDTELSYHQGEDEWYMIQHWKSEEDLKQASKKIFTDESSQEFVKSLDKHSVKMLIMPQIATWTI